VLAGGHSTRMGRDKAQIVLPNGRSLLDQALHTLRSAGASELFVSVRQGQSYGRPGTREVADSAEGCGPLAGLVAALEAASSDRIVVLAVDLPAMSCEYLQKLAAISTTNCGAVPLRGGFFEPLAAVYPKLTAQSARNAFEQSRLSLQSWVRKLAKNGLIQPTLIKPTETGFFANWNRPASLPAS